MKKKKNRFIRNGDNITRIFQIVVSKMFFEPLYTYNYYIFFTLPIIMMPDSKQNFPSGQARIFIDTIH